MVRVPYQRGEVRLFHARKSHRAKAGSGLNAMSFVRANVPLEKLAKFLEGRGKIFLGDVGQDEDEFVVRHTPAHV